MTKERGCETRKKMFFTQVYFYTVYKLLQSLQLVPFSVTQSFHLGFSWSFDNITANI